MHRSSSKTCRHSVTHRWMKCFGIALGLAGISPFVGRAADPANHDSSSFRIDVRDDRSVPAVRSGMMELLTKTAMSSMKERAGVPSSRTDSKADSAPTPTMRFGVYVGNKEEWDSGVRNSDVFFGVARNENDAEALTFKLGIRIPIAPTSEQEAQFQGWLQSRLSDIPQDQLPSNETLGGWFDGFFEDAIKKALCVLKAAKDLLAQVNEAQFTLSCTFGVPTNTCTFSVEGKTNGPAINNFLGAVAGCMME